MRAISEILLDWYDNNKRDLPWRNTVDPYLVWLSEIILQQTRVQQGLPYFEKFSEQYPTVKSLANSKEEDVLKLWQGLGYYSRARNMRAAAQQVEEEFGGHFPNEYKEIIKLQGVGDYTASAIASFCFKEASPVVDGNVLRFITRLYNIQLPIDKAEAKKTVKDICLDLIPKNQPDVFNQAIMEFGSLFCKPRNPDCPNCPFKLQCLALKNNTVDILPLKSKKTKVEKKWLTYYLIGDNKKLIINRRKEGIWNGLFEFHLMKSADKQSWENRGMHELPVSIQDSLHYPTSYKHLLSHRELNIHFVLLRVEGLACFESEQKTIEWQSFQDYGVPRIIDRFWEESVDARNKFYSLK